RDAARRAASAVAALVSRNVVKGDWPRANSSLVVSSMSSGRYKRPPLGPAPMLLASITISGLSGHRRERGQVMDVVLEGARSPRNARALQPGFRWVLTKTLSVVPPTVRTFQAWAGSWTDEVSLSLG